MAEAGQFLDPPKKAGDTHGDATEPAHKPADQPALGASHRTAS